MNLQMNAQNRIAIEQVCSPCLRLCAQLRSSSASSPASVSAHGWSAGAEWCPFLSVPFAVGWLSALNLQLAEHSRALDPYRPVP